MHPNRTTLRRAAVAVLSATLVATAAGTAQAHDGKGWKNPASYFFARNFCCALVR